jgi:hypothetical protein
MSFVFMQCEFVCFLNWLFSCVGKSIFAAGHNKGLKATGVAQRRIVPNHPVLGKRNQIVAAMILAQSANSLAVLFL